MERAGQDVEPMKRLPVESSAIASIGYDAQEETLEVEFSSGTVYRYLRVPADVAATLYEADSRGKYFGEFVRGAGYEYYRVS
jgi:KTSC domain